MTYRTGTIANTSPAANLVIQVMEPDMINVGWVKVSTNVVANQLTWNVYKSPGTNNQIAQDWYLALGWDTTSNANLQITLMEGWVGGSTNVAYNYLANTASIVPLANGICNPNPSALPNVTGSNVGWMASGTDTNRSFPVAGITYTQSITIDRVIIAAGNTSNTAFNSAFYAGTYDSVWRGAIGSTYDVLDTMPLTLVNLCITSAHYNQNLPQAPNSNTMPTLYTREIGQFASIATTFQGRLIYAMNGWGTGSGVDIYTQQYTVSLSMLTGRINTAGQDGSLRGTLKDLWFIPFNATPVRGDTLTFVKNGITVTCTCIFGSNAGGILGGQGWFPFIDQSA